MVRSSGRVRQAVTRFANASKSYRGAGDRISPVLRSCRRLADASFAAPHVPAGGRASTSVLRGRRRGVGVRLFADYGRARNEVCGGGLVTGHDDDFLARTEPVAEPPGGGLNHGASGYAEGLRRTRAERHASRQDEGRTRKAVVVGAGVMGAAVVAAAAFTILVLAGLVTVSSGVSGSHRTVTLAHQPPATTPPLAPSDATDPLFPGDTTAPFPPGTTAQTGRLPPSRSNGVAVLGATTGAQVPGRSSSNSSGSTQPSSASSNTTSDTSAPVSSTAPAGCSNGRRRNQASRCPKN
jgi:hypothetical protein